MFPSVNKALISLWVDVANVHVHSIPFNLAKWNDVPPLFPAHICPSNLKQTHFLQFVVKTLRLSVMGLHCIHPNKTTVKVISCAPLLNENKCGTKPPHCITLHFIEKPNSQKNTV